MTFSPTAPGQADGALTVKTADGETDLLGVHGVGTKDGLGATPATIAFTDVPTQTSSRQTVNVVNTGTSVATVTGVTLPANAALKVDPATVPAVGQKIQPLTSVPVSITFSPTTATPVTDKLLVSSDRGSPDRSGDGDGSVRRGAPAAAAVAGLRRRRRRRGGHLGLHDRQLRKYSDDHHQGQGAAGGVLNHGCRSPRASSSRRVNPPIRA